MAASKRGDGVGVGATVQRAAFAGTLLALGLCVGIVIGSVWELPGLLLRRLVEAPRTVSLAPPDEVEEGDPLSAFRELQSTARARADVPSAGKRPAPPPTSAPATKPQPEPKAKATKPAKPANEQADAPSKAPSGSPTGSATDRALADVAARAAHRAEPGQVIQVASYADRRSADALVTRLRREGFDCYVSDTRPGDDTRYRVRVRPGSGQAPDALVAELKSQGLATWVTKE